MLLLGIVGYFMYSQEDGNEIIQIANVGPGSPKAELILPQGQVIELDSSSREIVFSEHQSKATSVKNTLIYDAGMNLETIDFHAIRVPLGGEFNLQLSDNTRVHLNSGSSLRYPIRFAGDIREVFLTGEGFFEVTKDEVRPFVVKTGEVDVRVLGTSFNVNAYPENSELMATLLEGSVKVEFNNLLSNIILKPNEQLVYDKHTKAHNLRMPEIDDVTAWQRGELVFSNMYLEDIFTSLERKFPYAFVYSLHSLKKNTYSFRFSKQANLEEVMKIISQVVGNVNYVIKGNKCYVTSKE